MVIKNKLQNQLKEFSRIAIELAKNSSNNMVENILFKNLINNVVTIGGLLNAAFYGLPNSEVVHRLNTAIDEIGKSSYIIQLLLNEAAVKISLAQEFFLQKNELVDSIISLINDITES